MVLESKVRLGRLNLINERLLVLRLNFRSSLIANGEQRRETPIDLAYRSPTGKNEEKGVVKTPKVV